MRRGSAEPLIPCFERELRDVAGGNAERMKLADLGPELQFDEGAEPGEHGRGHQIAHYKIPRYAHPAEHRLRRIATALVPNSSRKPQT